MSQKARKLNPDALRNRLRTVMEKRETRDPLWEVRLAVMLGAILEDLDSHCLFMRCLMLSVTTQDIQRQETTRRKQKIRIQEFRKTAPCFLTGPISAVHR